MTDAATKPLHVEIERLRAALEPAANALDNVCAVMENRFPDRDIAWLKEIVKIAREALAGAGDDHERR